MTIMTQGYVHISSQEAGKKEGESNSLSCWKKKF
jgi:hypothetical protein